MHKKKMKLHRVHDTTLRIRGYIGDHLQVQLTRLYEEHGATLRTLDLGGTRIVSTALRCLLEGRAWPALR